MNLSIFKQNFRYQPVNFEACITIISFEILVHYSVLLRFINKGIYWWHMDAL